MRASYLFVAALMHLLLGTLESVVAWFVVGSVDFVGFAFMSGVVDGSAFFDACEGVYGAVGGEIKSWGETVDCEGRGDGVTDWVMGSWVGNAFENLRILGAVWDVARTLIWIDGYPTVLGRGTVVGGVLIPLVSLFSTVLLVTGFWGLARSMGTGFGTLLGRVR